MHEKWHIRDGVTYLNSKRFENFISGMKVPVADNDVAESLQEIKYQMDVFTNYT